ncbi:MAG: hypothetical protein Q8P67_13180 [archaeon]|nr:hypothetical protein [archaeon]
MKYGHFSANPDIECHGKLWSGANNLTEMRQREEARREWRAKHPVRYCLTQTCKFLLLAPSILLVAPVVLIMGILVLIFACCYFYCCKGQIPANNPDNPEPIIDAPTDVIIDI